MNFDLAILSLIIAAGSIGAILFRDLVHSVLSLAVTFFGLAGVYLRLGAEFIAFSQVIVYVGAVAILALFVVILTRKGERAAESRFSADRLLPLAVCSMLFVGLAAAAWSSSIKSRPELASATASMRQLGRELMSAYVVPLEVLGLLLTACMIGATILALNDDRESNPDEDKPHSSH